MSKTMHEHSGIGNPVESWVASVFGRWKGLAMSAMVSFATLLGILVTCGCCIIPCVKGLLVKMMARVADPGRVDSIYLMNLEARMWAEEWYNTRCGDIPFLECQKRECGDTEILLLLPYNLHHYNCINNILYSIVSSNNISHSIDTALQLFIEDVHLRILPLC